MSDGLPPGRRARLREQTTGDIVRVAREHLAAQGAAGLSLRAIARDLGMGVSSLYRYFPSRDDLLTALLVDAFDAQADAVEAAVASAAAPIAPGIPGAARSDAIRTALHAYRSWSLANPAEFGLAYGMPVPGYRAPAGRTVRAAVRVGDLLAGLLSQAWAQGEVVGEAVELRERQLSTEERQHVQALIDRRGYELPIGLMALAADLFVHIHGFVVMEVFGQLRPLFSDPSAAYAWTVDQALEQVGLRALS